MTHRGQYQLSCLLHSVEHDVKDVLHGGDLLRHWQMCCTMDVQMVSSDLRLYGSPHVGSGADKTKLGGYQLKMCENKLVSILFLAGLQPLNPLNPTGWWSELANGYELLFEDLSNLTVMSIVY